VLLCCYLGGRCCSRACPSFKLGGAGEDSRQQAGHAGGRAAQNMGQASPGCRERSHVNMPSRPTIWGKAQLLSAVVSRQAFTCLEAAARFLKGLKTLIDPLAQLSINTARPVSFRTPATHHRHPRHPHPPEFQPSQWRLRYVPLYLPSSPPLRPADAPRLRCDRRANRPQRERYARPPPRMAARSTLTLPQQDFPRPALRAG
jgi:hypothetical protein